MFKLTVYATIPFHTCSCCAIALRYDALLLMKDALGHVYLMISKPNCSVSKPDLVQKLIYFQSVTALHLCKGQMMHFSKQRIAHGGHLRDTFWCVVSTMVKSVNPAPFHLERQPLLRFQ
jgi:hypothetical protein